MNYPGIEDHGLIGDLQRACDQADVPAQYRHAGSEGTFSLSLINAAINLDHQLDLDKARHAS
jgi:hypothetical protein